MDIETYKLAEWEEFKKLEISDYYLNDVSKAYREGCLEGEYAPITLLCKISDSIGGSLLDIGSNTGDQFDTMNVLCKNVKYTTGVELHKSYLNNAKLRHPEIEWVLADNYLTLPFKDNSYDIVTIRGVLSKYFPENGLKVLNEAYRVAGKALIFKLIRVPKDNKEVLYWEKAKTSSYLTQWTQSDLNKFLDGKKFEKHMLGEYTAIYVVMK